MKLLINTATTYKGGGVQVAKSFIEECKKHPDNEYHVILGIALSKLIDKNSFPLNFNFYNIDYRPATKVFSFQDQAKYFKVLEQKISPDVVFTTTGPAYWRPDAPHLMGFSLPHYLYPDSPFFKLLPFTTNFKWKLKGAVIKYFARKDADAFVTQTKDVAERLKRWIRKENIYTVTNTYGSQYEKASILAGSDDGYFRFLILSAYYPHKNLEIINEVAEHARKDGNDSFRFVTTLDQEIYDSVFTESAKAFIENHGPVAPDECPALYNKADFTFLPTLLECFSATYAESMKMGKPILTTNLSFAHSVCGDAALYFRPLDGKDAYDKIRMLIEDEDLKQKLISRGRNKLNNFDGPAERAEKYLSLCRQLINK